MSYVRIPHKCVESQSSRARREAMLNVLAAMGAVRHPITDEWHVAIEDMPRFLKAEPKQISEGDAGS